VRRYIAGTGVRCGMREFQPVPDRGGSESRWQDGTDTFGRVYEVVLGATSPTPYTEISELADCSANAAKKHLERLAEMGIVRVDAESRPAAYERNDGYLEWQDATRIADDLSVDEIIDRVAELESKRVEYETECDAAEPGAVSVFDETEHETLHERMQAVSDWHGVIRDLRLYELARQLAENDGHLLPA